LRSRCRARRDRGQGEGLGRGARATPVERSRFAPTKPRSGSASRRKGTPRSAQRFPEGGNAKISQGTPRTPRSEIDRRSSSARATARTYRGSERTFLGVLGGLGALAFLRDRDRVRLARRHLPTADRTGPSLAFSAALGPWRSSGIAIAFGSRDGSCRVRPIAFGSSGGACSVQPFPNLPWRSRR